MANKKLPKFEFKPDPTGSDPRKLFHLTGVQRRHIAKWALYAVLAVAALVFQDSILSRMRIGGATTDLFVCVVLLVGILEGPEDGGLFALLGSLFYYFSGSAPGVYVVLLMTVMSIGGALFRQSFWSQSFSSAILCTGLTLLAYEWGLMLIGIFMNLTVLSRAGVFFMTALLSTAALLPLYPLVRAIAQIGGEPWKE